MAWATLSDHSTGLLLLVVAELKSLCTSIQGEARLSPVRAEVSGPPGATREVGKETKINDKVSSPHEIYNPRKG